MVSNMMIIEISKWLKEIAIQLQIMNRSNNKYYDDHRRDAEDEVCGK